MTVHNLLVAHTIKDKFTVIGVESITLEYLQSLVGGYIQPCAPAEVLVENIQMLVNEEGLLKGLPPNENLIPYFFVGDVVFVGVAGDEFVGLTDEEIGFIKSWLDKLYESRTDEP